MPPPPAYVPDSLEDLCEFIARTDLAPIAQAAIAHAQFDIDGNGRTGRALIYTVLRRRGEVGATSRRSASSSSASRKPKSTDSAHMAAAT